MKMRILKSDKYAFYKMKRTLFFGTGSIGVIEGWNIYKIVPRYVSISDSSFYRGEIEKK